MRRVLTIAAKAFRAFNLDDGWAIASHIALSTLMALFPFLLVLTALAGIFGSKQLADEAAQLLLETWPEQVARTIAGEVHGVLMGQQRSTLTVGVLLSVYFSSSGVEGLRIGLNRAYSAIEKRSWWLLRLEAIAYVIVGAVALLAFSFLVLLAPLIWRTTLIYAPWLEPFSQMVTFVRFGTAGLILALALIIVHLWLPAGRRRFRDIAPGVIATLALWLLAGALFGRYLADFAFTYTVYYAGLASVMIALVFLYLTAAIFIYGAELNSVVAQSRAERHLKHRTTGE